MAKKEIEDSNSFESDLRSPPAERVVLYTTNYCGYCMRARSLLQMRKISFTEIDVSNDSKRRAWLRDRTGRGTVPQIFIDTKSVGGCDDLMELDESGELESLLQ